MEKPETCEISNCDKKPKVKVILDGESYWFCDHDHADEFMVGIMNSGNY